VSGFARLMLTVNPVREVPVLIIRRKVKGKVDAEELVLK